MPPENGTAAKKGGGKKGEKRPLYLGLEIKGDNGEVLKIDKSKVRVVYATRDTRKVVEQMESNPSVVNIKTEV